MSKLMYWDNVPYNNQNIRYSFRKLDKFIEKVKSCGISATYPFVYKKKWQDGYRVLNVPCAFDTETTSVEVEHNGKKEKTAVMWIWMFGINGITIYGRTWKQFFTTLKRVQEEFNLTEMKKMLIYIHNMGFDFSFFQNLIDVDGMFLMDRMKALNIKSDAFEFRCSYLLSGCGLEQVGKDLHKYKVRKLVGDLDYDKARTSITKVTNKELNYCINDVRVQMAYIRECMEEENGNIAKIPYTFTGYVRRDIEQAVKADKKAYKKIKSLKMTLAEYRLWNRTFQGGFTHTNIRHRAETCEDVVSYDFTSSYPSVMIAELFPMSNAKTVLWEDWNTEDGYDKNYKKFMDIICRYITVFDIKIWGLKLKDNAPDTPIARAKCRNYVPHYEKVGTEKVDMGKDNGKVVWADYLETSMTNVGFVEILTKYYKFDRIEIGECYAYEKGYLPLPYIKTILKYYTAKTTLKGVKGKEIEYMQGKSRLNSLYGMMVMAVLRLLFEVWGEPPVEMEGDELLDYECAELEKYNESRKRVSWYPWGCMITEYARANLLNGIWEVGVDDYIYADTDSMKILNESLHLDYILKYNTDVQEKHRRCMEYYGLDENLTRPKTIKDVEKPLGVWDFDGHYSRFKAIHAKCYIGEMDDDPRNDPKDYGLHATIAGLAKDKAIKYIQKQAKKKGKDPFDIFNIGMCVPSEESGKNCHTYSKEVITFNLTDYNGVTKKVTTYGGVNLSKIPFEINDSPNDPFLLLLKAMGKAEETV